ncbi:MAG TPA: multicopper oxidase family protein, partial [Myxococcota bacterium]|nr:multicopper oxidase family protein [Myxococcota bacterium]
MTNPIAPVDAAIVRVAPVRQGVTATTDEHAGHEPAAVDRMDPGTPHRAVRPPIPTPVQLPPAGPHGVGHGHHAHGPHHGEPPTGPVAEGPVPEVEPMRAIDLANGGSLTLDMHRVRRQVAGQEISGISYGGSIPGPVLRVPQGSSVDILLRNRTDAETTLHPHGLRLDWRFDGVPGLGQDPVPPGGDFNYRLTFPDAGVYWYHPHIRDWAVRDQGAYGVFVVQPTDPNYYNPANREEVLALDDIAVRDPSARDGGRSPATHVWGGMHGDTMLVNGRTDYALNVRRGEVVRFHVLNAADTRVFNLSIPGARIKVVGSDIGRNEREEFSDSVMIAPAERYTIEALFDTPGEHQIVSRTPAGATNVLGRVNVAAEPVEQSHREAFERLRENAEVRADIDQFRRHFDRPADLRLGVELEMNGRRQGPREPAPRDPNTPMPTGRPLWQRTDGIMWEELAPPMNQRSNVDNTIWRLVDLDTGRANEDIRWQFNQGDVSRIQLRGGPMQHPIHFHGQRFLVLSVNGERNPNLQWKDTTMVAPGQTVEILVDHSNPGRWMFHCHIGRHSTDHPN